MDNQISNNIFSTLCLYASKHRRSFFYSFVFFGRFVGGDSIKRFYLLQKHIAYNLDLIEVIKLFMSFIYLNYTMIKILTTN